MKYFSDILKTNKTIPTLKLWINKIENNGSRS